MSEPHQYEQTPPPVPGPPAPPHGTGLATTALVLGLASMLVATIMQFVFRALIMQADFSATAVGLVTLVGNILVFVICVAAIVCGLIVLIGRRPGRARAGIATGIALSAITCISTGLLVNAVTPLLY